MDAGKKEGNQPEKGVEQVTLGDIRDEIRKQGEESRKHQTATHWLTTGLSVGVVVLAAGIGVLTTTATYRGLGVTMVVVGAIYIAFVIYLAQFYSKRTIEVPTTTRCGCVPADKEEVMTNGSDEKPTLSDWITFLSSEKNPNLSNIFNLGALIFVALAIVLPTTTHNDWLSLLVFGAILMWIFYKFAQIFVRRGDTAGKLLDLVMLGKLKDPLEIQNGWRTVLHKDPDEMYKEWQAFVKKEEQRATKKNARKSPVRNKDS